MIRTNAVNPDPRVEKEVNSIIKDGKNSVTVLAWDRESEKDSEAELRLTNGIARIIRFGIPSEWGGGFKKNMIPLARFSLKVHSWLKKNIKNYDCLHCCDLPTALMANPYIKQKKFVYDIYDYFADTAHAPEAVLRFARNKEKQMIEMADATILCSEQREKQIGDAKPRKLVVIHNSPDPSLLEIVNQSKGGIVKSNNNKIKLVYVGNLISERYVDVIADIVSNEGNTELHIGGLGPLETLLENYSKKYENVYFYGKMKYIDVIRLENECDIMLALYDPSIRNNQFAAPNKFYEALLVGKPLIMINNTGMDKIVSEESIGAVARTGSYDDLIEALKQAIDMCQEDKNLKNRMTRMYKERYSWDVMDIRLRELYNTL